MKSIISIVILFFFFNVYAQDRTWVFFDDEKCSDCFEQFALDIDEGMIQIVNKSEWLNAVSVVAPGQALEALTSLGYIKEISPVRSYEFSSIGEGETSYNLILNQIRAKALHDQGLNGKGVKVGVIDAGFVNLDSSDYFKHLHDGKQVVAVKDFFNPERKDFYTKETGGCRHGREVMKRITGIEPKKNEFIGLAQGAEFYLARTENGDKEARVEEDNWVAAIEWLHRKGVRLVNTSLGYATGFDDPIDDYIPRQMNGNTALITKAAQIAVRDKNMIIIVSAGNMGKKEWRIVSAPADAKEVISVGATKKGDFSKIGYSSIGADFVDYVKPDVSCHSPSGTSYSAPVITGLVACMLQKSPDLTCAEVKNLLQESSHLYPYTNNFVGAGVPNCYRLLSMMDEKNIADYSSMIYAEGARVIELGIDSDDFLKAVIFHKKDNWKVLEQQVEPVKLTKSERKKGKSTSFFRDGGILYLKLTRPQGSSHSTVQAGKFVYEIVW